MKLSQVASTLGARLENGSPDTEITGVAGIEAAGPGQVTFVSNPKYVSAARTTKATAVIVAEDFPAISAAMLRSNNPYLAFAHALELFHQVPKYVPGIHPTAVIDSSAKIGANPHIGPYVVISQDVEIGDDAVLLAHVVIYRGVRIGHEFFAHAHSIVREDCRLGNNVVLQNGVVLGSDGFGFAKDDAGKWHKILQPMPVVVGTTLKYRQTPVSTALALVKRELAMAQRSTTWFKSATALNRGKLASCITGRPRRFNRGRR